MVVAKSLMTECAKNYFPFKDMVEKSSFFFFDRFRQLRQVTRCVNRIQQGIRQRKEQELVGKSCYRVSL